MGTKYKSKSGMTLETGRAALFRGVYYPAEKVTDELCLQLGLTVDDEGYLNTVKQDKMAKIVEYDVSDNVNIFYVNGKAMWLDKATRVGLMNSTRILQESGHEQTTLWHGTTVYEVSCSRLTEILMQIEEYALECYNTTARHKVAVASLRSVQEIEAYDFMQGYPAKLSFSI